MKWSGNNENDREEEAYFYNVILQEEEEEEQRRLSSSPTSEFRISPFGGAVIGIVLFLCIFALFMGYAHIIGTLLGIGFIVFFIFNSLF